MASGGDTVHDINIPDEKQDVEVVMNGQKAKDIRDDKMEASGSRSQSGSSSQCSAKPEEKLYSGSAADITADLAGDVTADLTGDVTMYEIVDDGDIETGSQTGGDKPDKEEDKEEGEPIDPDALSTRQVIAAVVFLCAFSFSFATSFFLTTAARSSLYANFTDRNYTCEIAELSTADNNISCYGSSLESQCIQVHLKCEGFNETKLLYEYYHSYFTKDTMNCSASRCTPPNAPALEGGVSQVKYPHTFLRSCCSVNDTTDRYSPQSYSAEEDETALYADIEFRSYDGFYYDQNKPEAMFYMKSKGGTNKIVMDHSLAYIILVVPNAIMVIVLSVLLALFLCDKLSAKEIYRPVTPITPLHMEVNGKWYIKDVAPEKPKLNAFERLRAANAEEEPPAKKK